MCVCSGVAKDLVRAVELWTLASNQGHLEATFNLAGAYENGEGTDDGGGGGV